MRVNVNWLRDWIDFDLDSAALADLLTTAGLEVDAVSPVAGDFSDIVVAEVVACEAHPDADRLKVCRVDDGTGINAVVCGAPNVRVGLKTAYARPGAVLPGPRTIEPVSIRGVASEGMLCSAKELGISDDGAGILELPSEAPVAMMLREFLELDDDVLDIDLTPNRGDCFSVIGVAREIAAALGTPMSEPTVEPVAGMHDDTFAVRLDAEGGCPRFVGRVIRNASGKGSSPIWLKERLRRAGLRAIHPVVDVTNYVMLELGQPLHSYDLGKLDGEIVVRMGRASEKLDLLDGREITLDGDLMVIADHSGPVGLAGIMGGQSTAVEATTGDIFLEAAYFSPPAVAGRARRFGLHTDASIRFERGVDPMQQVRAIERATALLLQITGGEPGPVIEMELREHLPHPPRIPLRGERLVALLGHPLPPETVERALELLGMSVTAEGANAWQVVPPSFRFDLTIEEDLVEEVARIVGYDNIPAVPEFTAVRLSTAAENRVDEEQVADLLLARGYSEAITYSFVDADLAELINPGERQERLVNPISKELGVMRRSLWPGLLSVAKQNLSRQQERMRLFEIGTQFETGADGAVERPILGGLICGARWPEHWDLGRHEVDFYDAKNDIVSVMSLAHRTDELSFVAAEHPALRPGRAARIRLGSLDVGWLGELHPSAQHSLDLKGKLILFSLRLEHVTVAKRPAYQSYSKFPSIRRDLSVVVANEVAAGDVLECVRAAAGEYLQNVNVFDVYRGPGMDSSRKSMGLGLILQDTYRTLTDEDADRTVAAVVAHLGSELGATIRN